jgi:hypothetical protein
MSKISQEFRKKASNQLRISRSGGTAATQANNVRRAKSYKALAENAEWLGGENQRSQKRPTKKR